MCRADTGRLLHPFYWPLMLSHINFRPENHLEFISAQFRFDDIVNLLLQRERESFVVVCYYVCVPSSSKLCLSCFHVLLLVEYSILHLTVRHAHLLFEAHQNYIYPRVSRRFTELFHILLTEAVFEADQGSDLQKEFVFYAVCFFHKENVSREKK